jgi:rhodanese-related sulfurtransferase
VINRTSPSQFEMMYEEKPIIFDVRKKSEFDSQHIEGAVNVPLNEINNHLAQFPKDKPFVLHCAGGYRSMIAASILKQRGWENLTDVEGGFKEVLETEVPTTEYICPTTLL